MPKSWLGFAGLSLKLLILSLLTETVLAQEIITFQKDSDLVRLRAVSEDLAEELGPVPLLFEEPAPAATPHVSSAIRRTDGSPERSHENHTRQASFLQAGQEPEKVTSGGFSKSDSQAAPPNSKDRDSRSAFVAHQQQVALARQKIQERAAREALDRSRRLDARRHPASHTPAKPPFLTGNGTSWSSSRTTDQPPQFTKW